MALEQLPPQPKSELEEALESLGRSLQASKEARLRVWHCDNCGCNVCANIRCRQCGASEYD